MIREDRVFRSVTLSDLKEVAHDIVERLSTFKVWLISGRNGLWKDYVDQGDLQSTGVWQIAMSSPTFSIVNEYQTTDLSKSLSF